MTTHAEWLEERGRGIGASEVGTILGINPYDSAFALWLRKTGQLPPQDESLPMWLGHQMEPIIARRYEMETGRVLHDPGDYTITPHPDAPWLRATLDRQTEFDSGIGPVELKAPGLHSASEWADGGTPLQYAAQLQVQMAVTGATEGEIAAIVGNSAFYVTHHLRDDEFLADVLPVLEVFWKACKDRTPPAVDGSEATAKAIKRLHPLDNGETIVLPAEYSGIIAKWDSLKSARKTLQKEIDAVENQIKAAIADNTYGTVDGFTLSYKAQTRAAYTAPESTFRVLRKGK
jgi:putative phage-type endonuclease